MSDDPSDNEENTDSPSSSEEEDENAKEWTDEIEKTFLKTLSSLKKKDPKIYDENVKFFKDEIISSRHPPAPKEEPMHLKDYERKIILEKNGILTDEDSDEEKAIQAANERAKSPTYVEEQRILRENFKKISNDDDSNESEEDTAGFLKVKVKTSQEKEKEEADYVEWLKGQKTELDDKQTEGDLKFLRDYWTDPKLNEGEQFLRDYILNKSYLDPDQNSETDSELSFSEEEKQLEECDEYEQKYNFRFEEPDKNFIKTYPRVIENSLRRKDEKRKKKREALKKRKEEELQKKRLEVKKLKKQKKQELLDKIKSLKELTGNNELGFNDEELEKDFSADEYDRRMGELFNDEFYELNDKDDVKPQFSDSDGYDYENEGEDEDEDKDEGEGEGEDEGEDEEADEENENNSDEIIMDCDFDPSKVEQSKFKRQTRSSRKKGHKISKLMEVVRKEKAVFNASEKSFEQYLDEYYSLDFEDTIGDIPCRYKYRKVPANDFGLSVEEILAADDKELNKWVPMQKIDTIRPEGVEKFEQKVYAKKANNLNLKRKLLPSLFTEEQEKESSQADVSNEGGTKKRKKRRRSKKIKKDPASNDFKVDNLKLSQENSEKNKPKNQKQRGNEKFNRKGQAGTSTSSKQNDYNIKKESANDNFNKKRKATDEDSNSPAKKSIKLDSSELNYENNRKNKPKNPMQRDNEKFNRKDQAGTLTSSKQTDYKSTNKNNKKNKFKNQDVKKNSNDASEMADERLKAYGINPKKYKNRMKYAPK